jgi:biopolymer transport protein TolR
MAVSGMGSGGGFGRRRSLDAEVNLVPFIDLLSMCICFLLMTAVWTQLGSVQVKQANGTDAAKTPLSQTVDLDLKLMNSREAMLIVKRSGKVSKQVRVAGTHDSGLATRLNQELQGVKSELNREGLKVTAVMLTPNPAVPYGELVSLMDVFRRNEMVNIGVIPVKPTGEI